MSKSPESASESKDPVTPSRRERLRPLELIGFSAVLSMFATLVVFLVTRNIVTAGVAFAIAFIAATMVVALIGLGGKPSPEDLDARKDLQRPDGDKNWH